MIAKEMLNSMDGFAKDGKTNGKLEWREIVAFETARSKEMGLPGWPKEDRKMVNRIFHYLRGDDFSVDQEELTEFLTDVFNEEINMDDFLDMDEEEEE